MINKMDNSITITFKDDEEAIIQLLKFMSGGKINTIITSTKMLDLINTALGFNLYSKKLKSRSVDLITLYKTKHLLVYRGKHIPSRSFILVKTDKDGTQTQYTFKKIID